MYGDIGTVSAETYEKDFWYCRMWVCHIESAQSLNIAWGVSIIGYAKISDKTNYRVFYKYFNEMCYQTQFRFVIFYLSVLHE